MTNKIMVIRKEYNEIPKRVVWYIDWIVQGQLLSQISMRGVYNYKKMGIRFITVPGRNVPMFDIECHSDKTQWSHSDSGDTYGFVNVCIYPEDRIYTEAELYELLDLEDPDVYAARAKVEMKKLYEKEPYSRDSDEWKYRRSGTTTHKIIKAIYAAQFPKRGVSDEIIYIAEYQAEVNYAKYQYDKFMKQLPYVLNHNPVQFMIMSKYKNSKINPNTGTQIFDLHNVRKSTVKEYQITGNHIIDEATLAWRAP
jgi:hypothetical protein